MSLIYYVILKQKLLYSLTALKFNAIVVIQKYAPLAKPALEVAPISLAAYFLSVTLNFDL